MCVRPLSVLIFSFHKLEIYLGAILPWAHHSLIPFLNLFVSLNTRRNSRSNPSISFPALQQSFFGNISCLSAFPSLEVPTYLPLLPSSPHLLLCLNPQAKQASAAKSRATSSCATSRLTPSFYSSKSNPTPQSHHHLCSRKPAEVSLSSQRSSPPTFHPPTHSNLQHQ